MVNGPVAAGLVSGSLNRHDAVQFAFKWLKVECELYLANLGIMSRDHRLPKQNSVRTASYISLRNNVHELYGDKREFSKKRGQLIQRYFLNKFVFVPRSVFRS